MSEDNKFESKDELEEWLKSRGVDEDDVGDAAEKLFAKHYTRPSMLLDISSDDLKGEGLNPRVANHLRNKLKEQQQAGKLRSCFCIQVLLRIRKPCIADHTKILMFCLAPGIILFSLIF
jgi:hypothetical protein